MSARLNLISSRPASRVSINDAPSVRAVSSSDRSFNTLSLAGSRRLRPVVRFVPCEGFARWPVPGGGSGDDGREEKSRTARIKVIIGPAAPRIFTAAAAGRQARRGFSSAPRQRRVHKKGKNREKKTGLFAGDPAGAAVYFYFFILLPASSHVCAEERNSARLETMLYSRGSRRNKRRAGVALGPFLRCACAVRRESAAQCAGYRRRFSRGDRANDAPKRSSTKTSLYDCGRLAWAANGERPGPPRRRVSLDAIGALRLAFLWRRSRPGSKHADRRKRGNRRRRVRVESIRSGGAESGSSIPLGCGGPCRVVRAEARWPEKKLIAFPLLALARRGL